MKSAVNAPTLMPAQAQATHPTLVQILAQMQQLMKRSQHQPDSADKCVMLLQEHLMALILVLQGIIGQYLKNILLSKQAKVTSILLMNSMTHLHKHWQTFNSWE